MMRVRERSLRCGASVAGALVVMACGGESLVLPGGSSGAADDAMSPGPAPASGNTGGREGAAAPGDMTEQVGGSGGTSGVDPNATGGATTETPVPMTGEGSGAVLGGCAILPADNPWNTDISSYAVHANSDAFIDSIGRDGSLHPDFGTVFEDAPIGIPITLVAGDQTPVEVSFLYDDESDPGPYPIPSDALVEGGPDATGDRHVLLVETDNCILYELFNAQPETDGSWSADSGAIFDLQSNELRPERYTSADAAGLPIVPGLVRYDEVVEQGEILHALRFTVSASQSAYIHPATHAASDSTDSNRPPMGLRLRMKADYDCGALSQEVEVICQALKRYGMFMADNGSDWFVSGEPNANWSDDSLRDLGNIPGDAFEAVETGEIIPY